MKLREGVSKEDIIKEHRDDFRYKGRIDTVVTCWSKIITKEPKPSQYALDLMHEKEVSDNDHIEAPSQYYTQPSRKDRFEEQPDPDDWQLEQMQEKIGLSELGVLPSEHFMFIRK